MFLFECDCGGKVCTINGSIHCYVCGETWTANKGIPSEIGTHWNIYQQGRREVLVDIMNLIKKGSGGIEIFEREDEGKVYIQNSPDGCHWSVNANTLAMGLKEAKAKIEKA